MHRRRTQLRFTFSKFSGGVCTELNKAATLLPAMGIALMPLSLGADYSACKIQRSLEKSKHGRKFMSNVLLGASYCVRVLFNGLVLGVVRNLEILHCLLAQI